MSALVSGSSQYIRLCREFESLAAIEDFYQAAVPTLAVFYLHILHYHVEETSRILETKELKKTIEKYYSSQSAFFKAINLPLHVREAATEFVKRGVSDDRGHTGTALRRDIVGLLNK